MDSQRDDKIYIVLLCVGRVEFSMFNDNKKTTLFMKMLKVGCFTM